MRQVPRAGVSCPSSGVQQMAPSCCDLLAGWHHLADGQLRECAEKPSQSGI